MDDGFTFMCGSVPILLLIGPKGPGPGWPFMALVQLLAGCVGGWGAYRLFGADLGPDAGTLSMFLVAVGGGAFLGLLVTIAMTSMRGRVDTNVGR